MNEDVLDSFVEVTLNDPNDFLKIMETLTRIGIASSTENVLYQSCHILHKRGKYYIVHFLEMFMLDGKRKEISEEDIARRNTIISLLEQWGLLKVVKPEMIETPRSSMKRIRVIPFKEKYEWTLESKYTLGRK